MDLNKFEENSNYPLLLLGYGRTVVAFILNIWMLYNVADSIAQLSPELSIGRVVAMLILGSLIGISYPIVKNRLGEDTTTLTFKEKSNLYVIIVGVVTIQSIVMASLVYLAYAAPETTHKGFVLFWGFANVIVGIICDLFIGNEITVYVEKILKNEKK
jgi:hypothetical protein